MAASPNLPKTVSTIVLGVEDIEASVAFYRDTLELELKGQQGNLAFLALGDLTLMLSGGHCRTTGGVESGVMVTSKLHEAELPSLSTAVQITVLVPKGKKEPAGGRQVTETSCPQWLTANGSG